MVQESLGRAIGHQDAGPVLQLPRAAREEVLATLATRGEEAAKFRGLDASLLDCDLDAEIAEGVAAFCGALAPGGAALRLAHNDLGSGTDCEQRIFELKAERESRETEKAFYEKKKKESSAQKDFAVSAQMRRAGQEGIDVAASRLAAIDAELAELDVKKERAPWCALFAGLEALQVSRLRVLDLGDCGLHATGMGHLVSCLLELEHRAEGERVSRLVLDGNDLGDMAMGHVATLLRLSGSIEALWLRNVGLTETGVSQVLSGLVSNKSLALLDLRDNGLCSPDVSKAALGGVRRFNKTAEVLLD